LRLILQKSSLALSDARSHPPTGADDMQIDEGSASDYGGANEFTFDLIYTLNRLCAGSKAGATIDSSNSPDDSMIYRMDGVLAHRSDCRRARQG
jgi:hypothetical protein